RKSKKQQKPLNDLSRSLTPFDPNHTLIIVVENASSYCAPSYVIRTPGFFGRDLMSILIDCGQRSNDCGQQLPSTALWIHVINACVKAATLAPQISDGRQRFSPVAT